jgi:hypothetical protein
MNNSTPSINNEKNILLFKKYMFSKVLFFALLLPVAGALVFGMTELTVAYFSNLHDFAFGIIAAQIISIAGDVFTFCCLALAYCASGAFQMSFGSFRSKRVFALLVLSPIGVTAVSLGVFYLLVVLGWHDYSLRMFFDYLPVFLSNAGISLLVNTLVSVVVFCAFYLSGPMKNNYSSDARYKSTLKLVMAILIIIKVVSLGLDIVLYDGGYSSINNVIGGIIFPVLYEVLEIGAAIFLLSKFISLISSKSEQYEIVFSKK